MQEITGAKPVRDRESQTHLTQDQAALDVQVVSRRPFSMPPKHWQRCICSVSRPAWCNSGWGLHFHNSNAVEPALKQVSYARHAQGSTGDCDHSFSSPCRFRTKTQTTGKKRHPT